MNTPISPENPFGHTRHGFAWEQVPATSDSHLDVGCYEGHVLDAIRHKGVERVVGIDANRDAIHAARKQYANVEFIHAKQTVPLPFEDDTFDSITLLDVLEHVYEQKGLLDELARVLRPGGVLIVTVPRQHVFSWLDRGNFKFRFPRLHRWGYCMKHSRAEYDHRYVSNPDGLIGDIDARKRWHEHFTPDRLGELLADSGLSVVAFDGSALFRRVTSHLLFLTGWCPSVRRLIQAFERWDARRFASMNLFCLARKPADESPGQARPGT